MTITLTDKAIAVEVEKDERNFSESGGYLNFNFGKRNNFGQRELPSKGYSFLCLNSKIKEQDAEKIVERWDVGGFTDYLRYLARVSTALESYATLIQSKGLDSSREYAILINRLKL